MFYKLVLSHIKTSNAFYTESVIEQNLEFKHANKYVKW